MANPALTRSFKTAASEYNSSNMADEPKMSLQGTINKTLILFGLVIAVGLSTVGLIPYLVASGIFNVALFVSMFGALGLSFWIAFSKKVQTGGIIAYSMLEGVFVGLFSGWLNFIYPGIVIQAVSATMITSGVIFIAWKAGWIKVTDRFMKFLMFGIFGYLIFGLINITIAIITGSSIYDSGFGWIIALIGCGLASFSLAADFHMINRGIQVGLPRENEWRGAYGLMVTLIWLYVEILRLLSLTRD